MDISEIARRLKPVSETPLLEARLLVASVAADELEAAIQRRLREEPLSKIIGRKGFWKGEFITGLDVLDPRPDSETVIEAVLHFFPGHDHPYRILDIGTGSGCLLYTLLDEYPQATGIGLDISEKALKIAERNRQNRAADLICRDFNKPDWFRDLGQFDVIVSNPPYIPTDTIPSLSRTVTAYDPLIALDGGVDGLSAYRVLASTVMPILAVKGMLFLEIGKGQAQPVIDIFQSCQFRHRQTFNDFGSVERVLAFTRGDDDN